MYFAVACLLLTIGELISESFDPKTLTQIFTLAPIVQPAEAVIPSPGTPLPLTTFETPSQTPSTPSPSIQEHCVIINNNAPPRNLNDGMAPTAWDSWLELGKPNTVQYNPERGKPTKIKAPEDLPRLVHNGDVFCVPPTQP